MKGHHFFLLVIIISAFTIDAFGQSIFDNFDQIKPRNIGPAGMSGRVTAIDVDLSDKSRIFVGTASGGLWFSDNGGISWKPIFDDMPIQSIGAVKINQQNPSEIWVGTGEGNPRNSQNSGGGVYFSNDGGVSWQFKGLKDTKVIHRILIDESKQGVAYVGAQGSAWGGTEDRGLYKTSDWGDNWKKILYINQSTGVADMVMDPNNPNKIAVAMWEFGRKPWTFNSGGPGSGIHVTYDGGKTWKRLSSEEGMPKGDLGRIGLAVSKSRPDIWYALIEAKENALYKSTDGGHKWQKISTHENIGNRPFYYSEIYVDPKNENRLYSLWSYVSKSEDGGKTFDVIADYGNLVHPDHHAFWIDPDDPSFLIDGNDGGMAISRDMGNNWRFVNNLPVGQFYHVNVDDEFPYNVYGGMQDNGSWVGPSFVLRSGGITNHDWQEVYFGDGFDVAPLPGNSNMVYAMSQGGNLGLVDKATGARDFIKPNYSAEVTLRYNWNAAMALDPFNNCGIYYGSQFVHYSTDCGKSWRVISPDLTTNDTTKQRQDISGGLTIDATNAENNTTIVSIAPSPHNSEEIWAGTDDGRLQITMDGGAQWTDVYKRLPGAPEFGWIPQVEVSAVNEGEVFVVLNNYRLNDWSPYVYHTLDHGNSWTRIAEDNDIGSFVTSVLQDPEEPNLLFLGADDGLYLSFDRGGSWTKYDKGMPSVQIRDMKIQSTFDDLVIATFGRAFWVIDDIGPFRHMAREDFTNRAFAFLSSTPAYISEQRSYQGIRFSAQGEFSGDNKDVDAMFSIWVKPDTAEEKNKDKSDKKDEKEKGEDTKGVNKNAKGQQKKDRIYFTITDLQGDTVRSFSSKVTDKGLLRINWGLESDGVRGPSRRDAPEDADPPRGESVLPGVYKVTANYQENIDSFMVSVNIDPRLNIEKAEIEEMKETRKLINTMYSESAALFDRLKKSKKTLLLVEALTKTLGDSLRQDISELTKNQKIAIEKLEDLFMNSEGLKGIQRNPNNLTAYLNGARRYSGSYGSPGKNAHIAIEKARDKLDWTREQINAYYEGDWHAYKERIDQLKFDIFKD